MNQFRPSLESLYERITPVVLLAVYTTCGCYTEVGGVVTDGVYPPCAVASVVVPPGNGVGGNK